MVLAEEFYENNIKKNRKESQELNVKVSIVGWSRLVVVILAVVIDYILYTQNSLKTIILVTIIFSIIFLALVFYHNNIFECKKKLDLLV